MRIDLQTMDRESQTPLHRQLAELIRGAIQAEVYRPGDRIEPQREFMAQGNLSYATVSRALKDLVNDGWITRQTGSGTYVNQQADTDQCTPIRSVGVFYYRTQTPYFQAIMSGIERDCKRHGIDIVPLATGLNDAGEVEAIAALEEKHVDAVIAIPLGSLAVQEALRRYIRQTHPVVLIGVHIPQLACDAVTLHHQRGAELATQHLLDQGHERIGFMTSCLRYPHTDNHEHLEGIRSVYEDSGRLWDPRWMLELPLGFDEQNRDIQRQICDFANPRREHAPTAVICTGDGLAHYVRSLLAGARIRVPQDVSLVGCGDLPIAAQMEPALTTVRWPLYDLGRQAVRCILQRADHPKRAASHMMLDTSLVVRQSTMSPVF